jgi:hypothetical protein
MENSKQSKLTIIIGSAILLILAIVAVVVSVLNPPMTPKRKAVLEANATVPFGQYSFNRAIFNPNVKDLSILVAPLSKWTFEIKEDLFAIYDLNENKKFEVKNPKYEKRIMKDESETQTDGLRIYYEGGSIMPSEKTNIGIEYTVYDSSNYSIYRVYSFDKVVWISHYLTVGDKESLRYIYELKLNEKETVIDDETKKNLAVMNDDEVSLDDIGFEDLGEVSTEAQSAKEEK